ncbi:MAG: LytTR family DNA-binding domain-containing protein [Flavobacteriaceae bacterium]
MILKVIVVEDKKPNGESLQSLLEQSCKEIKVLASASTVDEAVKVLSVFNPDVVFLDIELQSETVFDVLARIKEPYFEVIFTTVLEKYAIKAIKCRSLDFLLKPIDPVELQEALEKARSRITTNVHQQQMDDLMHNPTTAAKKQEKICLATTAGMEFIALKDIILCKADGSYTTFMLKNEKTILVSKHLKEYENLLVDQQFMRVHNSYLINLNEVKKYIKSDGGYIIMSNDMHVNLSPRKKDELLEAMKRI